MTEELDLSWDDVRGWGRAKERTVGQTVNQNRRFWNKGVEVKGEGEMLADDLCVIHSSSKLLRQCWAVLQITLTQAEEVEGLECQKVRAGTKEWGMRDKKKSDRKTSLEFPLFLCHLPINFFKWQWNSENQSFVLLLHHCKTKVVLSQKKVYFLFQFFLPCW